MVAHLVSSSSSPTSDTHLMLNCTSQNRCSEGGGEAQEGILPHNFFVVSGALKVIVRLQTI